MARCFLLWAVRKSSLQLAPEVLWLVLVSVGCYMPDPGLEAILRDAASRKQNVASQNALTPRTPPILPTLPTVARHCNDLDKRNADLGWKSILRDVRQSPVSK